MSCCGCIFRLLLLVLLLAFTACMVLSNFFAQFRSTESFTSGLTLKRTVTYWYQQSKTMEGSETMFSSRVYTPDLLCSEQRKMFTATCSLAVAASALGALAALFTIFWMLPCCRFGMGVMVFLLTLLAGLCCAAVFGLLTWGFFHGYCATDLYAGVTAYHDSGFKAVEGYVLLCVAGLGFLATALAEAIGYCCVCCCAGPTSAKRTTEGPSEPTHEECEKEAPSYERSTSDNSPYANKAE